MAMSFWANRALERNTMACSVCNALPCAYKGLLSHAYDEYMCTIRLEEEMKPSGDCPPLCMDRQGQQCRRGAAAVPLGFASPSAADDPPPTNPLPREGTHHGHAHKSFSSSSLGHPRLSSREDESVCKEVPDGET